jgi:uncharacterized protein (TIGR02145 family)
MRTQLSKLAFTAALMLAITFTLSCSDDKDGKDSGGSCSINGGTVKIGTQTWMAKNLDCDVAGSKCYVNDPANCTKYGRLYDWSTAMKVCPSGWRLPSKEDWDKLVSYVESDNGCSNCAAMYLKATSDWYENNSNDRYGFSALPGGFFGGGFVNAGSEGSWWSASESSSYGAYYVNMGYRSEYVSYGSRCKNGCFVNVRCVQD